MRDPARIDRILAALGEHWKANPDLRLGQIVVNLTRASMQATFFAAPEVFYIEDDIIEKMLGPLATADLQAFYEGSKR